MRLGLGTVQFGLDYGVSNTSGKTPYAEVEKILETAQAAGIQLLDTATAYGASESVLGEVLGPAHAHFKIVTKTPAFKAERITQSEIDNLLDSFYRSLEKTKQPRLYGLLMHDAQDLLTPGGERLILAMQSLVEQGLVEKIGVSIYSAEEIDALLQLFTPGLMQLPSSVFDQRLLKSGHLKKLNDLKVEIHTRSIFLQGLLLMDPAKIPPYFAPVASHFAAYISFLDAQKLSPVEGALLYAWQQPALNKIIVGVHSAAHLQQIIQATHSLLDRQIDMTSFALEDEHFLNPAKWNLTHAS